MRGIVLLLIYISYGNGATPASVVPCRPLNQRKEEARSAANRTAMRKSSRKERTWLVQKLENERNPTVMESTSHVEEEGEAIECGCCFSSYPFVSFSGLWLLSY